MRIETTRTLSHAPFEVYAFLTDPALLTTWVKGLRSHAPLPGPARGVGARFRQELELQGGAFPFDGLVLEDEPGRRFAYRLEHEEAALSNRFDLADLGGATELRIVSEAELRSLRLRFVKGLVERFLREQMEANLERLNAALGAAR